jgi:hypothetical protein
MCASLSEDERYTRAAAALMADPGLAMVQCALADIMRCPSVWNKTSHGRCGIRSWRV